MAKSSVKVKPNFKSETREEHKPIRNLRSLKKNKGKSSIKDMKIVDRFPNRGVCYFSHIPHGFYEKSLEQYCSQFGKVTGVYHPVSKNGNSRGYAFVEFEHKEAAEVVAETMNNYLMHNRLVKCKFVPRENQRPWIFAKKDLNNMKLAILRRKEGLKIQSRSLDKEEEKGWKKKRLSKIKALHKKLTKLGIDYEFEVNVSNIDDPITCTKTED